MNIKNRLKKLESNGLLEQPCFCGKTLLDLWYGKPSVKPLTYCQNCKQQYNSWVNLAAEAMKSSENLTDIN
jgi:hypothetical protein